MSYTIVTDSSCNLPEALIERYGIEVLPLRFMSEGKEYVSFLKGKVTDLAAFYTMMRDGKVFTTSLPNQQLSTDIIRTEFERGNDILYIGFSSKLSGTYEATAALLDEIGAAYPDRRHTAVDTRGASLGEGLLVLYAARKRELGHSLDEVAAWLDDARFRLAHWFTVDDLMYLYRGGRVSRPAATAAAFLSIKPVLHMDDAGALVPVEKVRGRRRSVKALFDHLKKSWDAEFGPQTVAISHGDCMKDAQELAQMIRDDRALEVEDVIVNYVDPVIGAHSGPGTLALFYMAKSRD